MRALVRIGREDRVRRMIALGQALRDGGNMALCFAAADDAMAQRLAEAGFSVQTIAAPDVFLALVRGQKPDLLILDKAHGLTRAQGEAARHDAVLLAGIEDESDCRLACDFAFYPPLPRAECLTWAGARTVPRIGWNYALPGLHPLPATAPMPSHRPTLLVHMSDGELSERMARLLTLLDSTFRIRFVIGSGMGGKCAAAIVALKHNYETVEGADDLSTEYASADLALSSFGAAAYELAAFGVPALYLGGDVSAASVFARAGMAIALGEADALTDETIREAVKSLMQDANRRRDMRKQALALMAGGGASRIAADLVSALREEKAAFRRAQ